MVSGAERDERADVRAGVRRGRADAGDRAGQVWAVRVGGERERGVRDGGAARGAGAGDAHAERGAGGDVGGDGDDGGDDGARGGVSTLVRADGVLERVSDVRGGVLSGELFSVRRARVQDGVRDGVADRAAGDGGVRARDRVRGVESGGGARRRCRRAASSTRLVVTHILDYRTR